MTHSRHLLVTGGSRGIGAATVRAAVARGDRVTFSYLNAADAAEALCDELGAAVRAIHADAGGDDADTLVTRAVEGFGPLDGLVNNAGITGRLGRFVDASPEELRRVFDVNVLGLLATTRAVVRHWQQDARAGVIVNLSSIAATTGAPGEYVGYAGSKAAVEAITRGLGRELAPDGIRVVAISPGTTATGIHAAAGDPDRPARVAGRVPLGRVATPEEIADAILWALSDEASYLTATTISVAGGL